MRTRRCFLFECSAALSGFSLLPFRLVGGPKAGSVVFTSIAQLSYSMFAGLVNTVFHVQQSSGSTVELRLVEAPLAPAALPSDGVSLPDDAANERFSLIFSGSQAAMLAPGIYCFEHSCLGRFDLSIGPIGRSHAGRVHYEAVFNRPAPTVGIAAGGGSLKQEI